MRCIEAEKALGQRSWKDVKKFVLLMFMFLSPVGLKYIFATTSKKTACDYLSMMDLHHN